MPTLRAYLFGKFCILHNERSWRTHESCKVQELLCYLLFHRAAQHQREQLASLLWGESSSAQSKKYLRQTLWQLRASTEVRLGLGSERLVIADSNRIHFNPKVDLWTDVADFEQAYSSIHPGAELDASMAQRLKEAVELYQGDLLEGCYQDWCLNQREHLQNKYLAMLDKLIVYCESNGEYEAGLSYAARILQCDPARERAHQQMMRLYYLCGDRTASLRQFDSCAETLRRELDVRPTKRTLLLYEQIRADQLEQAAPPDNMTPAPNSPTSLPAVLNNLRGLQDTLTSLQRQLQRDIQMVEKFLPKLTDQS
jgi:DNA-binding SARP family transcriptional activator